MRVRLRKGYVLVVSPWFVRIWGRVATGTSEAKGAAMFPFLFVRDEEYIQPWLINHERVHFRQQVETLFVGLPVISLIERLYARFVLKMSKEERYLYAASEQEAYLSMHNPSYLKERPFGTLFHYIRHKRRFHLIGPGEIELLD
jgi:hypothetical protein